MGYHKREITKGKLGDFSKITEEYEELLDAIEQKDVILQLCELSDLIGAIESFIEQKGFTLQDLINFSNKTKQAFKEGKR